MAKKVSNIELDTLKVREKANVQELDIKKMGYKGGTCPFDCCGNCCWFFGESTDGDGNCIKHYLDQMPNCADVACEEYTGREEMRHHLAVLTRLLRWTRDKEHRHPVSWEDIMKAIEFAIEYIKTFNKL